MLGEFGPILRLGLESVLGELGWRVVVDVRERDLRAGLLAAEPAAVLLDLDAPTCADDALRLLARRPGLRVIGCSARRSTLRVFTATEAHAERPLSPGTLHAAIRPSGDGR